MKLWQLINPETGEKIGEPQQLPENWGPIFGLAGIKDQLGDLSWLGITDRAWIEAEVPDPVVDQNAVVEAQIKVLLNESLPMVAVDNKSITKGKRQEWVVYRQKLNELHLQPNYPNSMEWPVKPE